MNFHQNNRDLLSFKIEIFLYNYRHKYNFDIIFYVKMWKFI